MFVTGQNILINTSTAIVWNEIHRINAWHQWVRSIRSMDLLETPKIGAKGKIFFKNRKTRIFNILGLNTGRSIQIGLPLFWCEMNFSINLLEIDGRTAVTVETSAVGFWEQCVARFLGARIGTRIQSDLTTLKVITEALSSARNDVKLA